MKKQYFLLTLVLVATAFMATSCQKEKGTVTLGAEIQRPADTDSKVYLSGNTPAWVNGDQVLINDAVYAVFAANYSSAQIENVTASSSYRALYPANLVPEGTDISSSSSIPITLPAVQTRQYQAGRLKMDIPMGAYLTNGSTLQFHNLCSIVRITISNSLNAGLTLGSIVMHAENACLSGAGTAIVTGSASDSIAMSSNASHDVTLDFTGDNPYVEALSTSGSWDIIVPPFRTDNVTFTVNTTDGQYFEVTKPNVALNVSSGTLLSTGVVPIYGNLVGNTWTISTSASTINAPIDCSRLFYRQSINAIDFGSGFNTSNVTNMREMFYGCHNLSSLDVSNFNTSNVIDMSSMFAECGSLTSLNLSNFNTTNVTNMSSMFYSCASLTSLNLSNINTSNVTSMYGMFGDCASLTSLNLSNFNTSNVTDMGLMFFCCRNLASINLSSFNTLNVTAMNQMFSACDQLTSLDVSNFNTSNVLSMSGMFGCERLTSLDLSNFNTSNVRDMLSMFSSCKNLTNLDLSNFDMSLVMYKSYMCKNLSVISGACTIICPQAVEDAIKEEDSDGNYITNLPTSGVTFTWQRPSSK